MCALLSLRTPDEYRASVRLYVKLSYLSLMCGSMVESILLYLYLSSVYAAHILMTARRKLLRVTISCRPVTLPTRPVHADRTLTCGRAGHDGVLPSASGAALRRVVGAPYVHHHRVHVQRLPARLPARRRYRMFPTSPKCLCHAPLPHGVRGECVFLCHVIGYVYGMVASACV